MWCVVIFAECGALYLHIYIWRRRHSWNPGVSLKSAWIFIFLCRCVYHVDEHAILEKSVDGTACRSCFHTFPHKLEHKGKPRFSYPSKTTFTKRLWFTFTLHSRSSIAQLFYNKWMTSLNPWAWPWTLSSYISLYQHKENCFTIQRISYGRSIWIDMYPSGTQCRFAVQLASNASRYNHTQHYNNDWALRGLKANKYIRLGKPNP